jgi:hypothetical protein
MTSFSIICYQGNFLESDSDGIPNRIDNYKFIANTDQLNFDKAGIGDARDSTPIAPSVVPSISGINLLR